MVAVQFASLPVTAAPYNISFAATAVGWLFPQQPLVAEAQLSYASAPAASGSVRVYSAAGNTALLPALLSAAPSQLDLARGASPTSVSITFTPSASPLGAPVDSFVFRNATGAIVATVWVADLPYNPFNSSLYGGTSASPAPVTVQLPAALFATATPLRFSYSVEAVNALGRLRRRTSPALSLRSASFPFE